MEINRFEEVMGVIPTADIVEGRMGVLTTHTFSHDFGSRTDVPGFKVPATAAEAKVAKFIVTWQVDNREPPYFDSLPSYSFSLRQGFGSAANVPFTSLVRLTYPGYQDSQTIPSGVPSLAFGEGTYTVPSGCYIDSVSLLPGALIQVANTAEDTTDAGKLKYLAAASDRMIGVVEAFDSSNGDLTFRIF